MATGIKAAGVDLDSIFEPRVAAKISDVFIKSNGSVDLSNRFETLASGSAPPATGIKKAGADLNTLFAELGSITPPVVTYTGGDTIHHDVAINNTATAILRVRQDGTVQKTEGLTQTQLQSSTDWIIPNTGNDDLYEVKFSKGFLDDAPTGGDTLDVWHFIDQNRTVEYIESTNNTEIKATITTRIRYNGGAEIDNGTNSLRARVGTPI